MKVLTITGGVKFFFTFMPNTRYVKGLTDYWTPQFMRMVKQIQKGRPPGTSIPKAAIIPPKERLLDSELPFAAGDRVQIVRGQDKGKICKIIMRYPGFGNAFMVAGAGFETEMINVIEAKEAESKAENWEPVTKMYKTFDYKDLRLVSKIKTEQGDEDVAIHSLKLGKSFYDSIANKHMRERHAEHDSSIVIPWPVEKAEVVEGPLTTDAVTAEARTHFVTSALESPIPIGAIDQITNLNNRFKRGRYAPKATAEDIARVQPPVMPLAPKTKKMLEQIEQMEKRKGVEFTSEVEEFLGLEIKKGLEKRKAQHESSPSA